MAGFMPGESPPEVSTAIRFMKKRSLHSCFSRNSLFVHDFNPRPICSPAAGVAVSSMVMSLVAQIDADLKKAMMAREAEKLSVLRMLKSAVKYAAIEKGEADAVPSDADVLAVVRKEAKKREDSITSFTQAGRTDLADKEKQELEFLRTFLPAQMSPEKVEALVKEAIQETGATGKAQMGAVMKAAQAKAAGQVDGKTLSQVVQRLLA
jgi:uncharacterized protein YqeY